MYMCNKFTIRTIFPLHFRHFILDRPDGLGDDLSGQSFQATFAVTGRGFHLRAVGRGWIVVGRATGATVLSRHGARG